MICITFYISLFQVNCVVKDFCKLFELEYRSNHSARASAVKVGQFSSYEIII